MFFKGSLESLPVVAMRIQGGDRVLERVRIGSGAFGLLPFGVADFFLRKLRLFLAVPLGVLAGNVLVPELGFERHACPLVGDVIEAVGNERHGVDVGALPHDMNVLAAVFLVHHHGAGLAVEAKLFFEDIDGALPLLGRHRIAGVRGDVRVIKALGCPACLPRSVASPAWPPGDCRWVNRAERS